MTSEFTTIDSTGRVLRFVFVQQVPTGKVSVAGLTPEIPIAGRQSDFCVVEGSSGLVGVAMISSATAGWGFEVGLEMDEGETRK